MELPTARWADSVLQQYLGAPPHNVNASAQWDQCNDVSGCRMTIPQKVPFSYINASTIY